MNLATVMKKWRLMSDMTLRGAATEIGTSAATLLRIETGHDVDGRTLAQLLRWLTSEPNGTANPKRRASRKENA